MTPPLPYTVAAGRLEVEVQSAEGFGPEAVAVTVRFAEAPDEPVLVAVLRQGTAAEARRLAGRVHPFSVRRDVFALLRSVAVRRRPPAA